MGAAVVRAFPALGARVVSMDRRDDALAAVAQGRPTAHPRWLG
jgi:NADP-dependent 3-hydroxy acid dehydrogenase YdfG